MEVEATKKRIDGIDFARALAFIGMVLVHFKLALGSGGNEVLLALLNLIEGKAAATFVMLAGIGLAFMSNSAALSDSKEDKKRVRIRIAKRAVFLFVVGLSYVSIWAADILHSYGAYMLTALFVLFSRDKIILIVCALPVLIYPALMVLIDYELGWNFISLEYSGFWTWNGFFRHLFYNGFNPMIPWVSFMLLGVWFGRKDLSDSTFAWKALRRSLLVFVAVQAFSTAILDFLSAGDVRLKAELLPILGTSPMPPLPLYMISACSFAVFTISASILLAKKFENAVFIKALCNTGRLAFTFYVTHIIFGLGVIEGINPDMMGKYPINSSMLYALIFCLCCVLFAAALARYKLSGPLEWLMRKFSD